GRARRGAPGGPRGAVQPGRARRRALPRRAPLPADRPPRFLSAARHRRGRDSRPDDPRPRSRAGAGARSGRGRSRHGSRDPHPPRGHRERAPRVRQRRHRQCHGEPGVTRAHAQTARLPADRLLLARPGAGQRRLLPPEARLARSGCHKARADRGARAARGSRGGAALARAREFRARRTGRGGGRGVGRRRSAGPAAGAVVLDRMERFSVVGFVEALWKLPAHLRLLGRVRDAFRAKRYDLVILVDYPGYHLRAAAAAREAGIPVLYYIAPQMWAWAPGRVRRLAAVRRLAVILPFEERFFRDHGVAATFVGHPLRDRPPPPPRVEARRAL